MHMSCRPEALNLEILLSVTKYSHIKRCKFYSVRKYDVYSSFDHNVINEPQMNHKDNIVGMHYSQSAMIHFSHSSGVTEMKRTIAFGCFVAAKFTAYADQLPGCW